MLKQAQNDRFKLKYRFYMIFIENLKCFLSFYFVTGIILDHVSDRKSIFRYPKLKSLWKMARNML